MPIPTKIKAYIPGVSGELEPLAADHVVFELPSGHFLEVAWDDPPSGSPHPAGIEVWSGRRFRKPPTEEEIEALPCATSVGLTPLAANVVLVHPIAYPRRSDHSKNDRERPHDDRAAD